MSISVDDLVSSLSSSHIGQEATDIATLQAQLAQTLFGQALSSSSSKTPDAPHGSHYSQPCNTPTTRTPSSSFSWGQMVDVQSILTSLPPRRDSDPTPRPSDADNMEEDERMVEDLLIPTSSPSPMSANFSFPASQPRTGPAKSPSSPQKASFSSPSSSYYTPYASTSSEAPLSPQQSLFTSTDPFFLAQSQPQNTQYPESYFAQTGRPTQQSPFFVQPGTYHHHHPHHPHHNTLDLLVTTGAAFER